MWLHGTLEPDSYRSGRIVFYAQERGSEGEAGKVRIERVGEMRTKWNEGGRERGRREGG